MRDHYDFATSVKNPYFDRVTQQITIEVDDETINYFKQLAEEIGIPYPSLINLYLRNCAKERKRLTDNS